VNSRNSFAIWIFAESESAKQSGSPGWQFGGQDYELPFGSCRIEQLGFTDGDP
jgi:hypothetical protein